MKSAWKIVLILGVLLSLGCSLVGSRDDLDLDTTYFPFAEDYEWVYERHSQAWSGNRYDTFSIRVGSAIEQSDGWLRFHLEGGSFEDVGNPAMINNDQVIIFEGLDTIALIPQVTDNEPSEISVGYTGDTLNLSHIYYEDLYYYSHSTRRLKGVGVIFQEYDQSLPPYTQVLPEESYRDRLLYFRKGDTIWRY